MLTLKNPLTLQSISAFGIYSDSLGEKISGNYETFGASVTGEDLIHMTMQEPDIYVGIENSGPFIVEQQVHMDNRVRLELVNRLVNRLMLYPSGQFTYQDEVFVTAILQKLGVTDVNAFMQKVKLHKEENELAVSLLNEYFAKGRTFSYAMGHLFQNFFSDRQELEMIRKNYLSERCLHNDIFRRLMTAECSNTIYSYQNPVSVKERVGGSFQALMWMRQADRIQLTQFRENIYQQTSPAVFCDHFSYEMTPLTAGELTREKIIGRMSAAILENIVSVAGYALQYAYGSTNVRKNYSGIFYGSSKNALERFYYYQEHGAAEDVQLNEIAVRLNGLAQDELHLSQLLTFASAPDNEPEGDVLYEEMRQDILFTMLENQHLQKQLLLEYQLLQKQAGWAQPDTYYLEEKNEYTEEQSRFEAVYRILRQKKNGNYFSGTVQGNILDRERDALETDGVRFLLEKIAGENVLRERVGSPGEESTKELQAALPGAYGMENEPVHGQGQENGETVYELIHRYMQSGGDSDVPLMENIELLEQINRHNLYMKQLLDAREPARDTPRRVVVDRAQARDLALRALDHPEQVLREIYTGGEGDKAISPGTFQQIPDEIGRILSITDAGTRSYYERLMGYRSDTPKAGAVSGGVYREEQSVSGEEGQRDDAQDHPETEEMLSMPEGHRRREDIEETVYALLRWIDRREQLQRTYTALQTREIREQAADIQHRTSIRQIGEIAASEYRSALRRQEVFLPGDTEKNVTIVHRTREQTNQEIVDEVLETIGSSPLTKRETEEKMTESVISRGQLEQIRSELITQAKEQITHTVERSMRTHVHELSDMVYLELERRLKNEQRRRGY